MAKKQKSSHLKEDKQNLQAKLANKTLKLNHKAK